MTIRGEAASRRQATRFVSVIAATAVTVLACVSTERPISPYSREARRLLAENPITPVRQEPEACEFLGTRYAGPGIGVEREQQLVLQAGAVIGATHVVWEDQETAHFYRCSEDATEKPSSKRQVEHPVLKVASLTGSCEQIEILDRGPDREALRDDHDTGKREPFIDSLVGETGHRVGVMRKHDEITPGRPFEDLRIGSPAQSHIACANDEIGITTSSPSAKDRLAEIRVGGEPWTPWH